MAQVMNPNVQKDDSLNNIIGGLQIYSTVQDIRAKKAKEDAASMVTSASGQTGMVGAMQRRFDALNPQNPQG